LLSFLLTSGGQGVNSIYRIDTARDENPRTAAIDSVSGDTITLTSAEADLFFTDSHMNGVSYVRIWNISKSPAEPAWVQAAPAEGGTNDQLQVTDSADISSWANGETVQIGDPGSGVGFDGKVIALDISPMMQQLFGTAFRQQGVMGKGFVRHNTSDAHAVVGLSPDGSSGSFQNLNSFTDGELNDHLFMIPCTELSPVSNSNLVLIRERDAGAGTLTVCGVSVFGLLV
jgi:hypothetical protein